MTLKQTFAPSKYCFRHMVVTREDGVVKATLTVEVRTDDGRGVDTVHLDVPLTPQEINVLKNKVLDRLAQFEADEGLLEVIDAKPDAG